MSNKNEIRANNEGTARKQQLNHNQLAEGKIHSGGTARKQQLNPERTPKYTNEQLVHQIRSGIDVSENMCRLWQQNIGYINKLVNHYKIYAEEEDLQQEGYLGLYEAVQHYDSEVGVKFLTYAGHWIKQRFARYIKGNGTVRIPEFMQSRLTEYDKMVSKWQQKYKRKPLDAEICDYMNISRKMLKEMEKAAIIGKIGSLDVPVGEDGETSLCDLQQSRVDEEEEVVERIRQEQLSSVLWEMIDSLEGAQPLIIRERYQEGKTMRRIAEEQGCTFEEVRQQEAKGMKELRKPKRADRLRPFLPDSMIYSSGLCGNGFGRFNRTWTSSTERLALLELERLEKEQKEWMEINRGEQSVHP